MVGQESSNRHLWVAFATAIVTHGVLLAIQLNLVQLRQQSIRPLSVRMVVESPQQEVAETNEETSPASTNQQPKKSPAVPQVVVNPVKEPGSTSIQINSQMMSAFVKQEVKRYQQENEDALQQFSETFEPVVVAVLPDMNYRDTQGPLAGGQYKVRHKGSVGCVLHWQPLSFDDHLSGNSYGGSRDCSPEQKFELNPFPTN